MKILLISNMYPSQQKPYSGIFVKNQYEEIHSQLEGTKDSIEIYYMERKFTGPLGSIFKYVITCIKFIPFCFRKYDVVHLHYFYPLIILCWFYHQFHPSAKIVVTFHGGDINKRNKGAVNQDFFKYLSRCINLSIPVGKKLEGTVSHNLGLRNTMVLSAGVDDRVFFPPKKPVQKIYDFIFVGTFELHKGIDLIIDAIRMLDRKNLRFCFIGSGTLYNDLRELSENYQVNIFSNLTQPQIRSQFYRAKYHILPSRGEGFGLVVSEAMFCGIPSIVTPEGGLMEQVQDGINGYICESITADGILSAMNRALNTDHEAWEMLSENAKKNKEKFSLKIISRKLLQTYRTLGGDNV